MIDKPIKAFIFGVFLLLFVIIGVSFFVLNHNVNDVSGVNRRIICDIGKYSGPPLRRAGESDAVYSQRLSAYEDFKKTLVAQTDCTKVFDVKPKLKRSAIVQVPTASHSSHAAASKHGVGGIHEASVPQNETSAPQNGTSTGATGTTAPQSTSPKPAVQVQAPVLPVQICLNGLASINC